MASTRGRSGSPPAAQARSRDNLPNPKQGRDGDLDDYVPRNMPAIGDLFDMFNFGRDWDDDDQGGDRH